MTRNDIRLALPSKGALYQDTFDFLESCGLTVFRPNPRQYEATISGLPGVSVLFQRPSDIVVGVQQGTMDFGITGLDIVAEKGFGSDSLLILHDELGFGPCRLEMAVPETSQVQTMADLAAWSERLGENGRFLRIATKFPNLTGQFLDQHQVHHYRLVTVEGTLEIAPAIGYADLISDLVSSGITLRDNHLRPLPDGQILASQAALIAHKQTLQTRPEVLQTARQLLEYIEAHLRAKESHIVTANIRGASPEAIANAMFDQPHIGGLQGPTISRVVGREGLDNGLNWYAINIVVHKHDLFAAIGELRAIGGSGVIVSPCTYIFEEEPVRYRAMLENVMRDA
jgi:ATP phosphoribosyltransferase